ncbi:NUDIX hydrolase, partial [Staphylococcus aureus]|uniref:NUDIX hydrolase n=1 Tax=Staphylococcus aureus TaxID=1280 RepID=UPI001E598935
PLWLPPGGWVDRGETPQQAACREVREELGVPVRIGRALAARRGGYGEVTVLFEAIRLDDAAFTFSDEILRAEFFASDALPPMPEIVRSY